MEENKKTKGKRSDNKVALTLLSLLFNWLLSNENTQNHVYVIPCPWINNLSVTRQFQKKRIPNHYHNYSTFVTLLYGQ